MNSPRLTRHGLVTQWQGICHNTHIKTEFAAIVLALVAYATSLIGLHITPIVCGALAVILVCGDAADWVRDHRKH